MKPWLTRISRWNRDRQKGRSLSRASIPGAAKKVYCSIDELQADLDCRAHGLLLPSLAMAVFAPWYYAAFIVQRRADQALSDAAQFRLLRAAKADGLSLPAAPQGGRQFAAD